MAVISQNEYRKQKIMEGCGIINEALKAYGVKVTSSDYPVGRVALYVGEEERNKIYIRAVITDGLVPGATGTLKQRLKPFVIGPAKWSAISRDSVDSDCYDGGIVFECDDENWTQIINAYYIIDLKALADLGNNRKDIKADALKQQSHNCIPIVEDGQFMRDSIGTFVAIIAAKA